MLQKTHKQYFFSTVFLLFAVHMYAAEPNTVVATMNTGVTPAGIAITPDNRFAYVANNNNYGIAGQDAVTVLNLEDNLPVALITDASFNEPYTVTINAEGTIAYVTNSNSTTVTMIDIATNSVIGTINGFDGPSGMVITPAGTTAYVNNYGGPTGVGSGNGTTVRLVNLITNSIVGNPIVVGQAPAALALSPDGVFLYTVNYVDGNPGTGTMSVIRTSNNSLVATVTGFSGPFDLAITPDGRYAYVTNFGSNNFAPFGTTVSVVDLQSYVVVATIDVGIQPAGVAITPDGRYAYVTNYNTLYAGSNFSDLTAGQGTVTIIDIATNEVVPPTIAVGQSSADIAISPNGEFAYVTNYTSNTVDVIALQSFHIRGRGCKIVDKHSKEVVNKLTWKVSGTSLPIMYAIYRDPLLTNLAGTVPGSVHEFFDCRVQRKGVYTYYLIGVNEAGVMSEPIAITVRKTCKK